MSDHVDGHKDYIAVSSAELNRRFGEISSHVQTSPVLVTFHGKPRIALVAYEHFQKLSKCSERAGDGEERARVFLSGKLDMVLDNITEGYISIDRLWRITNVNRVTEMFMGMRREALIGRRLQDIYPNAHHVRHHIAEVMAEGRARMIEAPSSVFPERQMQFTLFPLDREEGGVGVLHLNMTAQSRSERSAAQAWQVSDLLLNMLPSTIGVRISANGTISAWSNLAERLTGLTANEVISRPFAEIYDEDTTSFMSMGPDRIIVTEVAVPTFGDPMLDRVRLFRPLES